jgi:hypothetical protein
VERRAKRIMVTGWIGQKLETLFEKITKQKRLGEWLKW